jgi:membrane associated rhomboid family serine protease
VSTPPEPPPQQWGTGAALPTCVRHPDRPTGLRCTRCERPACPECLREAPVGYQCVDCIGEARRTARSGTTVAGARPSQRLIVGPVLIVINLVVFATTAYQARSIVDNAASPLFIDGALIPAAVAGGEWWRVITSGFLHLGNYGGYGPVHLIFNLVALWILGRDLEPVLGRLRFLTVYLLSLVGGSAAVMLFGPVDVPTVGASGAIYGLFGGIAVVVWRLKLNMTPVLVLIGVNVFLSLALPGISLLGHLGGLAVGALLTAAMVYAPRNRRTATQLGAAILLAAVLIAMIAIRGAEMDCEITSAYLVLCAA